MLTLILGGSASGKSRFAEELVTNQPFPRLYLATMQPFDDESRRRIARHRQQRAGRGFQTMECYGNLSSLLLPPRSSVLLEDLGNLLANERFDPNGGGVEAVRAGLEHLLASAENLTVVTNEVFSGGSEYAGETLAYLRDLADVNRMLARQAELVVELVCGLPHVLKGNLDACL